jgi:sulfur relay (sulfurtransferase) DsrF/TusC family protein
MAEHIKASQMIVIMLRRPSYGNPAATEALRHAEAALSQPQKAIIVLIDGGVFAAKKGQEGEFPSRLQGLIARGVEICAERLSLEEQKLGEEELMEGVRPVDGLDIAGMVTDARHVMLF